MCTLKAIGGIATFCFGTSSKLKSRFYHLPVTVGTDEVLELKTHKDLCTVSYIMGCFLAAFKSNSATWAFLTCTYYLDYDK